MNTLYLTTEQIKERGHQLVDTQAEILRNNLREKKSMNTLSRTTQYV